MNQNILGDKRKTTFDDNLADYVNKIYANMPEVSDKATKSNSGVVRERDFYVEETENSYALHNMYYDGAFWYFSWDKLLLDGGSYGHQPFWIQSTKKLPTPGAYFASLSALHEHREGSQAELIEKIRRMFAEDFKRGAMMTNTRVTYGPGNDVVSIGFGMDGRRDVSISFSGLDKYIDGHDNPSQETAALFGTYDCEKVSKIFWWVTGKQTKLLKVPFKPRAHDERAVVLGLNKDFFIVSAATTLVDCAYARGVDVGISKFLF